MGNESFPIFMGKISPINIRKRKFTSVKMIEIKTLIDITNTEVRRYTQGKELELNQYRNWITLIQCLNLRSNITYDRDPEVNEEVINEFGLNYTGKQRVWTFHFQYDREDAYLKSDNEVGLLIDDLNMTPVIPNLTESINITEAIFDTLSKKFKNTKVSII